MSLKRLVAKSLVVLTTSLCVLACSDAEKKTAGAIPETQLQALEKARGVEDELKKQHEELRKKLDEE